MTTKPASDWTDDELSDEFAVVCEGLGIDPEPFAQTFIDDIRDYGLDVDEMSVEFIRALAYVLVYPVRDAARTTRRALHALPGVD